jgi:hypothetical protein
VSGDVHFSSQHSSGLGKFRESDNLEQERKISLT